MLKCYWQSEQIMSSSNDFTSSFLALETKGQVEHTALWDKNVHAVHSMHTTTYCRN